MSHGRTTLLPVLLCGVLSPLADCDRPPQRGLPVHALDVRVLTDARSVRSRLGEPLGGYLAEYERDFETRRVFIALDILKYEKGEALTVRGSLMDDSVRMSYGSQVDADFQVFRVLKAEPAKVNSDIEKLISGPEKKR